MLTGRKIQESFQKEKNCRNEKVKPEIKYITKKAMQLLADTANLLTRFLAARRSTWKNAAILLTQCHKNGFFTTQYSVQEKCDTEKGKFNVRQKFDMQPSSPANHTEFMKICCG